MQKSVEKYLSEVEKQLSSLPAELRASELRELRLHIEQLIETFVADGQSEEGAAVSAIEQFGQPKQLCRDLKRAYSKPQWIWARSFLALLAAILTEICIYGSYCSFTAFGGRLGPSSWSYLWATPYMFISIFIFSGFVGGWVAEVVAPRRAIRALAVLSGLRISLMLSTSINGDFKTALFFAAILIVGYCGTRLRQWQLNKRQTSIVC